MATLQRPLIAALAIAGLIGTACADTTTSDDEVAATADGVEAAAQSAETEEAQADDDGGRPVDYVGSLVLEPTAGPAGTTVTVIGSGLPAAEQFDVLWLTADCDWQLEGAQNESYMGRACTTREEPIGSLTTDDAGALTTTFTVPEDYGFAHDVIVVDADGVVRNQALFSLQMEVDVSPTSGPVGTPVTIEIKGMGWQSLEDTRTILWDKSYVGFASAVTTRGTATFTIPATGSVGDHLIELNRGAYTFPYMNPEQSPRPDIPTFSAIFTVTEGDPVLPPPIEEQVPPAVPNEDLPTSSDGPVVAADILSGPVGAPLALIGVGFDAGDTVELLWYRIVGNRVGGQGWEEKSLSLGEVTVGSDGSFEFATEVPGDVGGPHRVEAVVGGASVAQTSVSVTPTADPIATSVAWGTDLELHLTGVGWTETANIYTVVYDNNYVGYACGFNTQGDVLVHLMATGDPGWHFIDLYPAIYKGEELRGRDNFRIPQLTAADDHPGEDLPIFRFAFELQP